MASERELVLLPPGYAGLLRGVLGVAPHVHVAERIPEAVADHPVHQGLVAGLDPAPHAVHVVGGGTHRLHPARHDALGVTGLDGLRGEHHRLEP